MSLIPAFEIGIWNAWLFIFCIVVLLPFLIRIFNKDAYKKMGTPSDIKLTKTEKRISYFTNLIVYLMLIYSVFMPLQLGTLWFYFGLAIFLLGLVVVIVASVNFAVTPANEPSIRGMYRYSRHPMYLALFLGFLGASIASASWIFLLLSIEVLILLNFISINEERSLLEKYGETYRNYTYRTPRWIGMPKY